MTGEVLPVKIDVIIPAFNEEQSIGLVLREIPRTLVRQVVVCDNGSTDNTAAIARKAGAIVVPAPDRGYGNACLSGIAFLRALTQEEQPEIVVFMDADYSDHASEMVSLVEPIRHGTCDLVIGARAAHLREKGSVTVQQRFGNWLATRLLRILYGVRFTDLGPFRAIRWDALLSLGMRDRNYGWTVEMQVRAIRMQLRCTEIPVSYRNRVGKSKVSGTVKGTLLAGYKILWTIFKLR